MPTRFCIDGITRWLGLHILSLPTHLIVWVYAHTLEQWHISGGLAQRCADFGSGFMLYFALCFILTSNKTHPKPFSANRLKKYFAESDNYTFFTAIKLMIARAWKTPILKQPKSEWMTLWSMKSKQPYCQTLMGNFSGCGNPGLPMFSHLGLKVLFRHSSNPALRFPGAPFLLPLFF